jgi:hypothetical protein
MNTSKKLAVGLALAGAAAIAIAVPALSQQKSDPPIARYTLDASTTSGIAAMGAGGANVMSMLRGGGNQSVRELWLKLGSTRAPTGEPTGDHFMPTGAKLGKSVPLVTPRTYPTGTPTPGVPGQQQMPKGKLRLFWGCGEHAPKGQPVVIDFEKMAKGQIPPGLFAQALNLPDDWSIYQSNSRTYGDWPNSKSTKQVPNDGSLLGAHKVSSTYAPEINFTLADDFMPPLQPRTTDMPSRAVNLSWGALPKATGYYAWVIATNPDSRGENLDMTWWSSSSTQMFGGMLSDWLSPAAVKRLIDSKNVMPPSQTSCPIYKEVRQTGGEMLMTQLYAYGPQADFAYPPRPADPKVTWKPEWIARARFRANATVIHGMPGFGGADSDTSAAQGQQEQPAGKPKCPGGLRGIGMRAAGLCE